MEHWRDNMGKVTKYKRFRDVSVQEMKDTLEEYTSEELVSRYIDERLANKLSTKGIPSNRGAGQVLSKDSRFKSVSYEWRLHSGIAGQAVNEWFLEPEYL